MKTEKPATEERVAPFVCSRCQADKVQECRPEGGHTDGNRHWICKSCHHHWRMTAEQQGYPIQTERKA